MIAFDAWIDFLWLFETRMKANSLGAPSAPPGIAPAISISQSTPRQSFGRPYTISRTPRRAASQRLAT
jgi:hypothetical protein